MLSASANEPPWSVLPDDPEAYNSSRILVRFRPEAAAEDRAAILDNARIGPAVSLVSGLHIVELQAGVTVATALDAYRASPFVLYAAPDYRLHLLATPNDPLFSSLWA